MKRLTVTLTDEQYEALRKAAFSARQSMSAYLVSRLSVPSVEMATRVARVGLKDAVAERERIQKEQPVPSPNPPVDGLGAPPPGKKWRQTPNGPALVPDWG